MATPTITLTGATNGLLKITDHEGIVHRIELSGVIFRDSSNTGAFRLDIQTHGNEIILVYPTQALVDSAITYLETLF